MLLRDSIVFFLVRRSSASTFFRSSLNKRTGMFATFGDDHADLIVDYPKRRKREKFNRKYILIINAENYCKTTV